MFSIRISVRLGEWDLRQQNDCEGNVCADAAIDIPVEQLIPHEDYQSTSKRQENDIALIRLWQSVKSTEWIRPICLPLTMNAWQKSYIGIDMEVVGWGHTSADVDCKL